MPGKSGKKWKEMEKEGRIIKKSQDEWMYHNASFRKKSEKPFE